MTTEKAPSGVTQLSFVLPPLSNLLVAAFLTQTVTLEDQTTVKFEIWYVRSYDVLYLFMSTKIQGHSRTRALQGKYTVITIYIRSDCIS